MKLYTKVTAEEIKEHLDKIQKLPKFKKLEFPYNNLHHRTFEILMYLLYEEEIKNLKFLLRSYQRKYGPQKQGELLRKGLNIERTYLVDRYIELFNQIKNDLQMELGINIHLENNDITDQLIKILQTLNPREEKVIRMRFGIGVNRSHTLEEVGRHLSITRERVRQIEETAKDKMRDNHVTDLGLKVLRFSARDVLENMEGVLEVINSRLK